MKKILFSVLLLNVISVLCYSQKSNLVKADNYRKYGQLDNAKDAIDEATVNEQTKGMDKTWYYRGLIYHSLYNNDKYGFLCDHCLETAYEAFTKANEINPKNEWAAEITGVRLPLLSRDLFERGVFEFNHGMYPAALSSFEKVQRIIPNDTSAILNSAYSAEKAKNYPKAIDYYTRLITMHYHDAGVYMSLSNIYKEQKDTVHALTALRDGEAAFPDSINLILNEINILLSSNRNSEAVTAIDNAIKKDPKNSSLYLALGSSYDNLANPKDAQGNDLPKPVNHVELMSKAEQAYLKGLQANPNNYELNYNLGAIYFNQAAELANAANNIKSAAEYDKAKLRYVSKFQDAQPYLERALELSPNDRSTLISLRQLYLQTNQTDKYNKVKAVLDNLK
jgi:tetratricopeptide (TPR) repeat protein